MGTAVPLLVRSLATLLALAPVATGGPLAAAAPRAQVDRVSPGSIASSLEYRDTVRKELADAWLGQIGLDGVGTVTGGDAVAAALRDRVGGTAPPRRIVRLAVDRSGKPTGCAAYSATDGAPAAPLRDDYSLDLCRALIAHASLALPAGFVIPGPTAYVTLDVDFLTNPALARPVAFAHGREGVAVAISRTGVAFGEMGDCAVVSGPYDLAAIGELCGLWNAEMRARRWRASDGRLVAPLDHTQIYVRRAEGGRTQHMRIDLVRPLPAWPNNPLFEPLAEAPDALTRKDGNLMLGMDSDDYPPAAMRSGLAGVVKVELRFGADRRVASCRPVGTSGVSQLDNAACAMALKRGRWSPNPDTPDFVGRPGRAAVRWILAE